MLPRITPLAPTRIRAAFDDPDFIWELKHDGFRALAYVEAGSCQLVSRKSIVYKSFPGVVTSLAGLKVRDVILDGELACLDNEGRSQFRLMRRRDVLYYAFDCLWLDGVDLRPLGLMDRKRVLHHVLKTSNVASVFAAAHVQSLGTSLFRAVCQRDCEGIVAKHKRAPYVTSPATWFKVLNPDYSQRRGRREMFEAFRGRR